MAKCLVSVLSILAGKRKHQGGGFRKGFRLKMSLSKPEGVGVEGWSSIRAEQKTTVAPQEEESIRDEEAYS